MTYYAAPGIVRTKKVNTFEDIENVVCDHYSIPIDGLYEPGRKREYVLCRSVIAFFALEILEMTVVAIGKKMSRHYTSIINYRKNVYNQIRHEESFRNEIEALRLKIQEAKYL